MSNQLKLYVHFKKVITCTHCKKVITCTHISVNIGPQLGKATGLPLTGAEIKWGIQWAVGRSTSMSA